MLILIGIAGVLIVVLTTMDALWTTLVPGLPSISGRTSRKVWRALLRSPLHRSHKLRVLVGPLLLVAIIIGWVMLLWLGWSLIFLSAESAVLSGSTNLPVESAWSRIYFAGYALITLGVGDFRPGTPLYQLATILASVNGFCMVTLSITYIMPVLGAAVQGRLVAGYIRSLGDSPQEVLTQAWNGRNFGQLSQHLIHLTPMIVHSSRQYTAYPVLHYYQSADRKMSLLLNISILDEAIRLLELAAEDGQGIDGSTCRPTSRAIGTLLNVAFNDMITPEERELAAPSLEPLRAAGIRCRTDEEFSAAIANEQVALRRRFLHGLIQCEAWEWDDVLGVPAPDGKVAVGRE